MQTDELQFDEDLLHRTIQKNQNLTALQIGEIDVDGEPMISLLNEEARKDLVFLSSQLIEKNQKTLTEVQLNALTNEPDEIQSLLQQLEPLSQLKIFGLCYNPLWFTQENLYKIVKIIGRQADLE